MKTFVLHSANDIDKLIKAALADLPSPPVLPNLPSISDTPPSNQKERDKEIEQIREFFSEHPEVFTFESRVSSYVRQLNKGISFDVDAPTMTQDKLDTLMESTRKMGNRKIQEIIDKYAARLNVFVTKLNTLKARTSID